MISLVPIGKPKTQQIITVRLGLRTSNSQATLEPHSWSRKQV